MWDSPAKHSTLEVVPRHLSREEAMPRRLGCATLSAFSLVFAESSSLPAFEVASIKPSYDPGVHLYLDPRAHH